MSIELSPSIPVVEPPSSPTSTSSPPTIYSLRLNLPEDLFRLFQQRASALNLDIETLVLRHLSSTQEQDIESGRSIKISPEERQQIETLWKRSFKTGKELIQQLEMSVRVQVGPVKVLLSPDLLKRLDGRRGRRNLREFLTETVTQQLEHYVGLR
jgi:hypothetical protein